MSIERISVPVDLLGAEEEQWRQRVGALGVVPALLRQLQADPAPVLAAAGLNSAALEFADNTIPYAAFGRLLDESARRSGCAYFGLLVGQAWHLSTLGLLGQLMRHSPTVGEALRMGMVHHHLNSQGGVVFLREQDDLAEYGYAIYHGGARSAGSASQIYDAVLATLVNYMRELCGTGWAPTEVLLAHAPAADASPYRRLFRCPVRFDCDLSALRFPAHWLGRPVEGADPAMLRRLEGEANTLARPDLIEKLRRSLRVLLLNGVSSSDAVAELLAMHRRTLNRRLKAVGTTFRDVLEDVRFEAACQLLGATHLSLDDIALALGYAGVTPFARAFRRRSGVPPGQWRREFHVEAGGSIRTLNPSTPLGPQARPYRPAGSQRPRTSPPIVR